MVAIAATVAEVTAAAIAAAIAVAADARPRVTAVADVLLPAVAILLRAATRRIVARWWVIAWWRWQQARQITGDTKMERRASSPVPLFCSTPSIQPCGRPTISNRDELSNQPVRVLC